MVRGEGVASGWGEKKGEKALFVGDSNRKETNGVCYSL